MTMLMRSASLREDTPAEEVHAVRLVAKKFRYHVEYFRKLFPAKVRKIYIFYARRITLLCILVKKEEVVLVVVPSLQATHITLRSAKCNISSREIV
jgi:hypothetical protein